MNENILTCISDFTEDIENLQPQKEELNLSEQEYLAIKSLKNNKDIVIKKADKGSATIIMNKCNYIAEGYRQLNNPKFHKKNRFSHIPSNSYQNCRNSEENDGK